jgi:hypothetical protein
VRLDGIGIDVGKLLYEVLESENCGRVVSDDVDVIPPTISPRSLTEKSRLNG